MKMAMKYFGNHIQNNMKLANTVASFDTDDFSNVAKAEIQKIAPDKLPLQQGLTFSSYVGTSPISVVILNHEVNEEVLKIKTGIFYTGIIAGCSCSDDPSPTDEQNEYCELLFSVEMQTANTRVELL